MVPRAQVVDMSEDYSAGWTAWQDWVEAFTKAQGDFPTIGKGSTVNTGTFTYKYASLPDIFDLVNPVLRRHDLVLSQSVGGTEGTVAIETRIAHKSGHVERYGPLVMKVSADPKAVGSAITYARRYALCAALGIAPDEDDDGAKASEPAKNETVGPWPVLWERSKIFKAWSDEERQTNIVSAMKYLGIEEITEHEQTERIFGHLVAQYEMRPGADQETLPV